MSHVSNMKSVFVSIIKYCAIKARISHQGFDLSKTPNHSANLNETTCIQAKASHPTMTTNVVVIIKVKQWPFLAPTRDIAS